MNMSMQTFIKEYRQNPVDKIPIPVIGMQVWDSVRKKLWNWWWCWWSIYNENACLSVSLCDSLCVWLHMSFSFLTPTKNHENQPRIVSLAISTGLPVAAASEGPQERTSLLLLEFSPWPLRLWRRACKGMQGKSSLQTALISSNFNFLSSHVNSFKINLKFLTWVIILLASSIYISIYNFWPYVICHHQNQCFTYASIFSWYLIPLFSKQPNRSSMRSQERMALFVSWTSHLQGGIDIFHQKKTFYFDPFRGSGYKYMEYVMSAVFPTLYGWMATFNRRVFHQLPTVVLQVSFLVGPDLRVDWALSWQLDLDLTWWLLEKAGPPLHLKIGTLKKK